MVIALLSILIAAFLPPNPVNTPNSLSHPPNFTAPSNFKPTDALNPSHTLFLSSVPEIIIPTPNSDQSSSEMHKIISQFNLFVEETFQKTNIPGSAVLVVYQDQVIYMKCLGVKEAGKEDPVNFNTLFQIGSLTKAFTSTAMASLVDEGKMNWDDKVRLYYPDSDEFALYNSTVTEEVNMRDLLSHRCGLPTESGADLIKICKYDFQETLYRLRYIKPDTEFRSTWEYNQVLYTLAGECASRAAGQDWEGLVEEAIFTPLEMTSSTASFQDYLNAPNRVSNHIAVNKTIQVVSPDPDVTVVAPAGSISSSIKDLANWVRFQLNEGKFNGIQVLSTSALEETHKPHIARKSPSGDIISWYGLGWGITPLYGKIFIDHTGSTVSSVSYISLLPSDELGIVVLSNEGPYGGAFNAALVSTFYDLYLKGAPQADYWSIGKAQLEYYLEHPYDPMEHLPPPPANPVPSKPLSTYTGNYYSDFYGNFKIVKNDTLLQLYAGANPQPYSLIHWSGDVFKENSTNTAANFTLNSDGVVQTLHLRMFDYSGSNGTFIRV